MSAPSRDPSLPNFLVIGAMRSGTTSLFHYLRAHPQVWMSPLKEVEFFIEEGNWWRGLDWYRRRFGDRSKALAIGEASTAYAKYPEHLGVPERIAACLPDVRLIYLVRDPIERIRSHYEHRVHVGSERSPLQEAVVREPSYVNCSRYGLQLERYLEWFPRERILVTTSEELRTSREKTMQRVYEFLGVDADVRPDAMQREFYTSQGRATYPPFMWSIRRFVKHRVPVAKRAKEFIDSGIPRSLGRLSVPSSSPMRPRSAPVPDSVRRQLAAVLREDIERLRRYMPEGFGGWGIG